MKIKKIFSFSLLSFSLLTELLFTVLPVSIIIILRCYQRDFELIFFNTEWAVCAIILFGQSIVKFSSGISNQKNKFRWQIIAFVLSLIIIVGLIPSVTILAINILSQKEGVEPSLSLHIFQMVLFVVSCVTFFTVGGVGQQLLDGKPEENT